MVASRRNGTLYVGVTNDLARRALEHREKTVRGFTHRHDIGRLV
jgi:putative endonuclease